MPNLYQNIFLIITYALRVSFWKHAEYTLIRFFYFPSLTTRPKLCLRPKPAGHLTFTRVNNYVCEF